MVVRSTLRHDSHRQHQNDHTKLRAGESQSAMIDAGAAYHYQPTASSQKEQARNL